ncbi:MAG: pyridoxal phosphate-dependent aminotransferase [Bacteroidia bacterium]|nr:pyridoxal phosphate-dependent aminotransferase [Bacteroidia bacterium]
MQENLKLSNRITELEESKTIAMARLSRDLKKAGKDIISLSLGEPDFVTPTEILEGAKKAIDDGFTFYPPVNGFLDLREAIANKFKTENDLDYSTDQIVVSNGAKQCLINTFLCTLNPGDEVIIPTPFWVSYLSMAQLSGASVKYIDTTIDADFKITAEQLENAITSKTKAFVFSSPSNPTGAAYTKEELAELVKVFEKHPQVIIISDEIYEHLNFAFKHGSIANFSSMKDRTVVINGVSKAYAMTGWRIGYMAAPEHIAKACQKLQGQFTSGACSVAQKTALAALKSDKQLLTRLNTLFKQRRDNLIEKIKCIDGFKVNKPEGAFYLFPEVSSYFNAQIGDKKISNANDLCMYLLEDAGVSMIPGDAFGSPNNIRIAYAISEEVINKAIDRVNHSLQKLNSFA